MKGLCFNFTAIFIILSCLAITALAQNQRPASCPTCRNPQFPSAGVPDWCPPCTNDPLPAQPSQCGINCLDPAQRNFLFPSINPNNFWSCVGSTQFEQVCACPTLFDFSLQRCVHAFEWTRQCNQQPNVPTLNICPACPGCDAPQGPTVPGPGPVPVPVTTTRSPNDPECPCFCTVCIAW